MAPVVFGALADGTEIREVTLRSQAGATATIMEWGAVIRDLVVPLKNSEKQRVVLGLTTIEDYVNHSPHMGALAGRFANRIGGGVFHLDGEKYQLPLNQEGRHSLHGGGGGFGSRPWRLMHHDANSLVLALHSPAGDHAYPGAMDVTCRYTLAEPATLRVELTATTDAPTILNLCQHSYFNLDGSSDILDHTLEIRANIYTPTDDVDRIPSGEMRSVAGTPLDFRKPRPIRHAGPLGGLFNYDNNYMLRGDRTEASGQGGLRIAHAATLASPKSGLSMETWTTEPCVQFYDGYKMKVPVAGLDGAHYGPSAGLCLEPQHVPDSPNLPHFPSTVLRPGEVYRQVTEYRFVV